MNSLKPLTIIQALALFEEKNSADYGLALWAALHEAEQFYKTGGAKIDCRRFYISPSAPTATVMENVIRTLGKVLPGEQMVNALELLNKDQIRSSAAPSMALAGPPRRTYDAEILDTVIRKLVDPKGSDSHLMIITDRPITPPPKWRYIICLPLPSLNSSVISVAPLDPEYWREKDPQRIMTIKTRMRTVVLSQTGELAGLVHCDNPACFLFADVDGVEALDQMAMLGKEHEMEQLAGYGFDDAVKDPTVMQPVVVRTSSRRRR